MRMFIHNIQRPHATLHQRKLVLLSWLTLFLLSIPFSYADRQTKTQKVKPRKVLKPQERKHKQKGYSSQKVLSFDSLQIKGKVTVKVFGVKRPSLIVTSRDKDGVMHAFILNKKFQIQKHFKSKYSIFAARNGYCFMVANRGQKGSMYSALTGKLLFKSEHLWISYARVNCTPELKRFLVYYPGRTTSHFFMLDERGQSLTHSLLHGVRMASLRLLPDMKTFGYAIPKVNVKQVKPPKSEAFSVVWLKTTNSEEHLSETLTIKDLTTLETKWSFTIPTQGSLKNFLYLNKTLALTFCNQQCYLHVYKSKKLLWKKPAYRDSSFSFHANGTLLRINGTFYRTKDGVKFTKHRNSTILPKEPWIFENGGVVHGILGNQKKILLWANSEGLWHMGCFVLTYSTDGLYKLSSMDLKRHSSCHQRGKR
tara:strand:- start:2989 stop:4257 length:1269 start_codon:yes stop_codon:yes gene_type:complete